MAGAIQKKVKEVVSELKNSPDNLSWALVPVFIFSTSITLVLWFPVLL